MHSFFEESITLDLDENQDPITAAEVNSKFVQMKGAMNKAVSCWKRSGNGKSNAIDGKEVRLNGSMSTEEEDVDYVFVDDDRFDFCGSNIAVAYWWASADHMGHTEYISQNCTEVGLDMNNIQATSTQRVKLTATKKKKNESNDLISGLSKNIEKVMSMMATELASPFDSTNRLHALKTDLINANRQLVDQDELLQSK